MILPVHTTYTGVSIGLRSASDYIYTALHGVGARLLGWAAGQVALLLMHGYHGIVPSASIGHGFVIRTNQIQSCNETDYKLR